MRIPIREQLALLILLSALIGLAVISIATWVTNHSFVLGVRSSRLSLTASLKAAQLASNLNIMQTSANFVSTRVLIQSALQRYNELGNNTAANWVRATADMAQAISGGGSVGQSLLFQTMVFPKNDTGVNGPYSVMNVTSDSVDHTLPLPIYRADGSQVYLGDDDLGYPAPLYPNLTYSSAPYNGTFRSAEARFNGDLLDMSSPDLLLGPYLLNDTFSLVSLTMPIINNTSAADVLGWLTVVMDARLITAVLSSNQGLDETGQTLLVGPVNDTNHFPRTELQSSNRDDFQVEFVYPLSAKSTARHPLHVQGQKNPPFNVSQYPAIRQAITQNYSDADPSGAILSTRNENHDAVSVGYAIPQVDIVDWVILVEQAKSEVWQPINHLRDVLLACVFATFGFLALLAYPLAHFASLPIRRLRAATEKAVEPPNSHPSRSSFDSLGSYRDRDGDDDGVDGPADEHVVVDAALARKEGWNPVSRYRQQRHEEREARRAEKRKRQFRIPAKVKERKHVVKDELSDLTLTFNEMSDELMMQYEKLEERVRQRTAELETSKKAAEAANESKTLFIANISHELKTPLNGILGMCAVCMQEDDPQRLKRSLGIIYKSGDLLLNLLTDLLTFSKNQVGQHLSLDEKEFRLRDISSQMLAIFDKQAREGQIKLSVEFQGVPDHTHDDELTDHGPIGTGRLKDMILWGDTHRILQVVINLVSNSLKFTPAGGSVTLRIRCLEEAPQVASRKSSTQSRHSRPSYRQTSRHKGSDATLSIARPDTGSALVKDTPFAHVTERPASPPPGRYLYYEFEVQDTGPGIPENLQQRIFEPFVQGDLGLSKKYGGTGLGLSICSQLASLMRGTIGVRSTLGEGSTFTMNIPLRHLLSRADSNASSSADLHGVAPRNTSVDEAERTPARHSRHLPGEDAGYMDAKPLPADGTSTPVTADSQPRLIGLSQPFFAASQPMESPGSQPAAMEKITAEATRGGRIRVLVAEDNKTNQEVVLRMLKLEEIYDVTVAKDGQEALDMVKASMSPDSQDPPYNLIFMDVQMPNVDGLQSTRLIREIGYQAPIVALTAFSEESNIKDCLDSGMNYFLSKPIRRPQLKKVLKEYCAPIMEEEEEVTPPEMIARRGSASQNTTIVMVNGPPATSSAKTEGTGTQSENMLAPATTEAKGSMDLGRTDTHEDDRPVSPLSTA